MSAEPVRLISRQCNGALEDRLSVRDIHTQFDCAFRVAPGGRKRKLSLPKRGVLKVPTPTILPTAPNARILQILPPEKHVRAKIFSRLFQQWCTASSSRKQTIIKMFTTHKLLIYSTRPGIVHYAPAPEAVARALAHTLNALRWRPCVSGDHRQLGPGGL